MADVFLSHSRRDRDFALRLHDALVARGKEVWVDEQDIPPSARWRDELREAISAADCFAFLISPDSAVSPQCAQELGHAETLVKRVIGVMVRATDPEALPDALASRQFVPQRGRFDDDFERSLATLITAIEADLEWVKTHVGIEGAGMGGARPRRQLPAVGIRARRGGALAGAPGRQGARPRRSCRRPTCCSAGNARPAA